MPPGQPGRGTPEGMKAASRPATPHRRRWGAHNRIARAHARGLSPAPAIIGSPADASRTPAAPLRGRATARSLTRARPLTHTAAAGKQATARPAAATPTGHPSTPGNEPRTTQNRATSPLTRLRSFRDDLVSPVDLGAAGMGIHAPPPAQRFDPAEDRASPRPDVLAVLETVAAGSPRDRITGVAEQLVWLLVHAHHRARRVVRTAVGRQDVLHPRPELRIRPRRNGPALLQVRTKFRFFSTRPMVE